MQTYLHCNVLEPSSLARVSVLVWPEKKMVGGQTAQVVRAGAGVAETFLTMNGTMRKAAARTGENMVMDRIVEASRLVVQI